MLFVYFYTMTIFKYVWCMRYVSVDDPYGDIFAWYKFIFAHVSCFTIINDWTLIHIMVIVHTLALIYDIALFIRIRSVSK